MDLQGVEKGLLGIRYLLKYLENGRLENFLIVKDCIEEIRLNVLITFYANNMDYLVDDIPDNYLENIFTMKPILIGNSIQNAEEIDYGKGFRTKSKLSYKEQFKLIRNALCHQFYQFENGLVKVFLDDYEAQFDIKWLERMNFVLLANERMSLKKDMSDITILSLAQKNNSDIEEFKKLIQDGLIHIYKVTSLTSNQNTIKNAVNVNGLDAEDCTFDFIFQTAIYLMQQKKLDASQNSTGVKRQIESYFKEIESYFGKRIRLELLPIKVEDDVYQNEDFINLSFVNKLKFLINHVKFQSPVSYNSIIAINLCDFLDNLKEDRVTDQNLLMLKDAEDFLLKIYAYMCFVNVNQRRCFNQEFLDSFGAHVSFDKAKDVYKNYLKALEKSLKSLRENGGSLQSINHILKEINYYSSALDEVLNNQVYKDFAWKMRNALVHNHVTFCDGAVKFFTTGKNISLKHYSKKKKDWEYVGFSNTKPIWQMEISKEQLVRLINSLLIEQGIQVNVNISKYIKRKSYGR